MNNGSLRPFASVVDILFHPQICLSHLSIPSVQQTSGLWNFMLVSLLPLLSCGHRTFLHAEAQFFHIYLDLGIHAGHLFSAGLLRKHNCARAMWTAGVRLHYRFCETSVVPCTGLGGHKAFYRILSNIFGTAGPKQRNSSVVLL